MSETDVMPEEKKEYRKLGELIPWKENPRIITPEAFERLKYQIKELNGGKPYKPLLINQDNIVLGGNQRIEAYKSLGIDPVWVHVVHTENESDMWKFALSDNDHSGTTDMAKVMSAINRQDLTLDWNKFAIDMNNSVLLTNLKKYSAEDLMKEWKGMPEFKQENQEAKKQIVVNFKNWEDYEAFAKLIGQALTPDTRSIWYPFQEREKFTDKSYE